MTNHPDPRDLPETANDADTHALTVSMVRSGGVAGFTRRWHLSVPPYESARWKQLVERCPWDAEDSGEHLPSSAAAPTAQGADRFTWTIEAHVDGRSHRAIVNEADAEGAWRTLIDAVRDAAPSPL